MKTFLKFLRIIGIPFIIAFGIYTFIRFVWLGNEIKDFQFTNINTEEYLKLYSDSKESIIFAFDANSDKKNEYEQIIKDKFYGKVISIYFYDITNISSNELEQFKRTLEIKNSKDYKLPILIYTINGQAYDILFGYKEPHYVQDLIERNNID